MAAAAMAEVAAAEALLASKVQAMEAEGHPVWKVQVMEAEERENILSLIHKRTNELGRTIKDLSDASEKARVMAECRKLNQEYSRVLHETRSPVDYSGMTEAERAAEAERLRQKKMDEARRLKAEGHPEWWVQERIARVIDCDPKQNGMYHNRMYPYRWLETSDIDEESPLDPLRFTDKLCRNYFREDILGTDNRGQYLSKSLNFLSVTIACSDVGFPIQVYGSVIVRDSMDYKCIYLFRRDRNHCQLISSKDESLILTGPRRGLVLLDQNYVETDLKIKDHQGQDRELSKGLLDIRGLPTRSEQYKVESNSIETRLSTVDFRYTYMKFAVEGAIAVRVVEGEFYGTITAHSKSIRNRIVLYDSKKDYAKIHDDHGFIQLFRPVVSVHIMDMLIICAKMSAGESERHKFTPKEIGGEEGVITLGATKMHVKLTWSIMYP